MVLNCDFATIAPIEQNSESSMSASTVPDQDLSFTAIAEDFVRALRDGQSPEMEEYIQRYPKFEEEIRDEFPLMVMAEEINHHTKKELHSPPLPAAIGKYRIKSEIGKGGMGRVYAATAPGSIRDVAIKVLLVSGPEHRDSLIRFQREAKSAGKLNHPNIVPVYDYGVHEQYLYFVMPRIKGIDLSKLIDGLSVERARSSVCNLSMDWRMVAEVGSQVAGALGYAHSQGLIHRDIKPANLIMENNGRTWVSDFGLVKNLRCDQSLSRTGDLIGTPRYMAPEQLRGVSDARSDIYGLGLTLYELATGHRAWDNLSGQDLVFRRSSLELPPIQSANPAIPDTLCDIIMKCCAFRPDDRYQTANEVQYVLNRYLHGHKVGDRRKDRNSDRSILKRKPIRIARACATLSGIAIFVGFMYSAAQPRTAIDPNISVAMMNSREPQTNVDTPLKNQTEEAPAVAVKSETTDTVVPHVSPTSIHRVASEHEDESAAPQAEEPSTKTLESEEQVLPNEPKPREFAAALEQPSILPYAHQFDWVSTQVVDSGLKDREKAAGQKLLLALSREIFDGNINAAQVERLRMKLNRLVEIASVPADDASTKHPKLSDIALRQFLGYVELEVSAAKDRVLLPQQVPTDNVLTSIDTALKNPEVRRFLQNLSTTPSNGNR